MDRWLERTGAERGYVATAQTMYEFSKDWYADRMSEGWEPFTAEQASRITSRHGLTGAFWSFG